METNNLETILKKHSFFAGLDEETLLLVAGCAKNVRFPAGAVIARQSDPSDEFYLIREGRVAIGCPVPQGGSVTIETVDDDDIVGWSWLMPPYQWQFDVTAQTPVRALSMNGKCLRDKCDNDPKLGYELMKRFSAIMVRRLAATRLQLLDVYGNGVKSKK